MGGGARLTQNLHVWCDRNTRLSSCKRPNVLHWGRGAVFSCNKAAGITSPYRSDWQ